MANHDETTTPRPGSRMDLIQLQTYSDRAVSCPFADKIEDVYVYIYSHCYVYEGTMHNTCISVHGFINWITLTKRPPETRQGIQKRLSSLSSSSISLPSTSCILLLTRSCFFRGDRIRGLTDGNHDPLCPSRGPRLGRFQPGIPLTFRMFR